jgi:hypothetical protein
MEAVCSSETVVSTYKSTRHFNSAGQYQELSSGQTDLDKNIYLQPSVKHTDHNFDMNWAKVITNFYESLYISIYFRKNLVPVLEVEKKR